MDGREEAAQWKRIGTHSTKSLTVFKKKKNVSSVTMIYIPRINILPKKLPNNTSKTHIYTHNTHTHPEKSHCAKQGLVMASLKKKNLFSLM